HSKAKAAQAEISGEVATGVFHDLAIEAAFLAALPKLQLSVWDGPVTLFRPPPDQRWKVTGGRWVNSGRDYVIADNGSTRWMSELQVIDVPGVHGGMVLQPNVRGFASVLRALLRGAESRAGALAGVRAAEWSNDPACTYAQRSCQRAELAH